MRCPTLYIALFLVAALSGQLRKLLLSRGADVNARSSAKLCDTADAVCHVRDLGNEARN